MSTLIMNIIAKKKSNLPIAVCQIVSSYLEPPFKTVVLEIIQKQKIVRRLENVYIKKKNNQYIRQLIYKFGLKNKTETFEITPRLEFKAKIFESARIKQMIKT